MKTAIQVSVIFLPSFLNAMLCFTQNVSIWVRKGLKTIISMFILVPTCDYNKKKQGRTRHNQSAHYIREQRYS